MPSLIGKLEWGYQNMYEILYGGAKFSRIPFIFVTPSQSVRSLHTTVQGALLGHVCMHACMCMIEFTHKGNIKTIHLSRWTS